MLAFQLAYKELLKNKRFSLFFLLTLSIGFTGFTVVDSLKISIDRSLSVRAKGILAADLAVSARRSLTPEEMTVIKRSLPSDSTYTGVFESYTMLSSSTNSRLVELKAIEPGYPFYGEIELSSGKTITAQSEVEILKEPKIWVFPELLLQLDLKLNDKIKVGEQEFVISDTIIRDSSGVGGGFSFAPPAYVGRVFFENTGLMQKGITGYHSQLVRIPDSYDAKSLANELNKKLTDPAIRVSTSENASEQVGRLLGYLGDYLGLSGLVALFLTVIGQIFLFRNYLTKRHRDIAVYKCLGFSDGFIFKVYFLQTFILGALALIPTLFITSLFVTQLQEPIKKIVNIDIALGLYPETVILTLVAALLNILFICGPLLLQALKVRPKELFHRLEERKSQSYIGLLYYLPAVAIYYGLSVWLTQSILTGTLFFALFACSLGLLTLLSFLSLKVANASQVNSPLFKMALRGASRDKFASVSAFVAISLGVLLANLIPALEVGIKNEIAAPDKNDTPSLFLVDIQDEQIREVQQFLVEKDAQVMQVSPMIRARLAKVNEENFEKGVRPGESYTREEENENRFRNRGFNLTYRQKITPSEKIISQLPASQISKILPEISLEKRFADRLNLKLGDQMTFDIQGVEFSGLVTTIRKIRWTSFQPNFFVQFGDTGLSEAPKTFLLTLATKSPEQKSELQLDIVKKFPNISILDVSRLIERITEIITQMSFALKGMAFFTILVGFIILFSIAIHKAHEKRFEMNLYKVLGASFKKIQFLFITEFLFVVSVATFFGIALSQVLSFTLSHFLFDSSFAFNSVTSGGLFLGVCLLSAIVSYVAARGVLRVRPLELLKSG